MSKPVMDPFNVTDFLLAITLFQKYHEKNQLKLTQFQNDFATESLRKLKQLQFLITKVRKVENKLRNHVNLSFQTQLPGKIEWEQFSKQEKLCTEIEAYTECIYYLAFRTRCIFRTLPGLESFEATAIRDVRNHLLEHSEHKDSLVTSVSFGHIGPHGPTVKPARPSHQSGIHIDRGLYKNLHEFLDNLCAALMKEITPPQSYTLPAR